MSIRNRCKFAMSPHPPRALWAAFAAVLALAQTGCTTTEIVRANSTPAIQSQEALDPELLLDIGVMEFAPGIPSDDDEIKKALIVPEVRRAESRFIAYHLRNTLEQTGNWGAVRVTPGPSKAVDLTVWGEILMSDGEKLRVRVTARDATGTLWLNEEYEDSASKFSYRQTQEDPFQDIYNAVANDLLAARNTMDSATIHDIRMVAALEFASSLSPDSFEGYLQRTDDRVSVLQQPADGDPMVQRIERIKEREYLFVDTLDDYYDRFYREMSAPYRDWRQYTYDEAVRLRQMEAQSRKRLLTGIALVAGGLAAGARSETYAGQVAAAGTAVGGIGAIRSGLERRRDAEVHAASLRELSESMGQEITPIVLDVEGRTVELQGSVDNQYGEWRRILKDIYQRDNAQIAE